MQAFAKNSGGSKKGDCTDLRLAQQYNGWADLAMRSFTQKSVLFVANI